MTNSTWDKSLETGNKMIDDQHRQLIRLIDDLSQTKFISHKDTLVLLNRMHSFTIEHFISEEQLMEEVNYPSEPKLKMIKQHKDFKSYVRLRILEFRYQKLDITSFQLFAGYFLKTHEFGTDRGLANWIKQQEAA